MKSPRVAVCLLALGAGWAALLLAACDPIHGVQSGFQTPSRANLSCIYAAIRATEGVGTVERGHSQESSFQVLPWRGTVIEVADYWTYGPNSFGILQVHSDGQSTGVLNGHMQLHDRPAQADVDAFVPLMRRVNESLQRRCALPAAQIGNEKTF